MLTTSVLTNLARPELLLGTVRSLARGGLPDVHLHVDLAGRGHTAAYIAALEDALDRASDPAGWALLCEDDIAVPVGFGPYVTALLEKLDAYRDQPGFATLFCSLGCRDWVAAHKVEGVPNFGRLIPNDCYAGTQCILFPVASLAQLLPAMRALHRREPDWGGDRILGRAAEVTGLMAWCHLPSLADHRGRLESTLDSRADNRAMIAADYVGDAWEG